MMSREPEWRGPGETDWRLPPYTRRGALIDAALAGPRLVSQVGLRLDYRRTRGILRAVDDLRLALGSGARPPAGWHGLDLFHRGPLVHRADLLLGIPADRASVSAVLAEHVLEHLYLDDLPRVLAECRRVMAAGAAIRVVSPDAAVVARLIGLGPSAEDDPIVVADLEMHRWADDGLNWARTINRISHQWGQHRSLLTADIVTHLLRAADFSAVVPLRRDESRYFETGPPDMHPLRFPDEDPIASFAVEALAL